MTDFYPSLCWVPKASFALLPKRAEINAEYQKLLAEELQARKNSSATADSAEGRQPAEKDEDEKEEEDKDEEDKDDEEAARIERQYNLADYDDEDADGDGDFVMADASEGESDGEEGEEAVEPEEEAEDDEDFALQESDNLLVVAEVRQSAGIAQAQVHVYNEPNKQFYLHHDFYLDSLPLCFEWVGAGGRNLLAVGRMEPGIQLWDLDVVDSLARLAELGGADGKKKKKKKKDKKRLGQPDASLGHSDAVLDVAWNRQSQQALASASADNFVGLWDLDSRRCLRLVGGHSDKVQTLAWHPAEPQLLLSGAYDSTCRLTDCRSPDSALAWQLDGECERCVWQPANPLYFYCSTEAGSVVRCDARAPNRQVEKPLKAHEGACSGLSITRHLLCTGGADGLVKLWRTTQNSELKLVAERDWQVGEVTKLAANPNCDCVLAVSGMAGHQVWDTREDARVRAFLAACGETMPEA